MLMPLFTFKEANIILLGMIFAWRAGYQAKGNAVTAFSLIPVTIQQHSHSMRAIGRKTSRLLSSKSKSSSKSPPPPPIALGPDDFPDWAYEPRDFFRFEILHESTKSGARVGRIHTPHGIVDTPGYVAVATNAALKGVDFRDADEVRMALSNYIDTKQQQVVNKETNELFILHFTGLSLSHTHTHTQFVCTIFTFKIIALL